MSPNIRPKYSYLLPIVYHTFDTIASPFSKQQIPRCSRQRKRHEKIGFVFAKVLDFLSLLRYVVVLIGGTAHEKYDKRALARKHYAARGQQN
jgi:hypothetical protein